MIIFQINILKIILAFSILFNISCFTPVFSYNDREDNKVVGKFRLICCDNTDLCDVIVYKFQSLYRIKDNFYVLAYHHQQPEIPFKHYKELEEGKIYNLILLEYKVKPILEPEDCDNSGFYIDGELIWEDGKFYKKLYYSPDIYSRFFRTKT